MYGKDQKSSTTVSQEAHCEYLEKFLTLGHPKSKIRVVSVPNFQSKGCRNEYCLAFKTFSSFKFLVSFSLALNGV